MYSQSIRNFLKTVLNFSINSKSQMRFQSNLKTYKINNDIFQKILSDELLCLKNVFEKYKFQLRIAGGAVRDLAYDIIPHDIDLATNALPTQMIDMFDKENIRIINLKGLKHGTIPVRINDKVFCSLILVVKILILN